MNRVLIVAMVACVILFVLAVLIAPTIDLQPSALRAQQWLNLIAAMFSLAGLFEICIHFVMPLSTSNASEQLSQPPMQVSSLELSCCLLC